MSRINTISKSLVKRYKEEVTDAEYVFVECDELLSHAHFKALAQHAKKYKMKSFHVKDVIPVSDKELPGIVWDSNPVKYKKETLSFGGRQGVFKIEFSDGSIMMACWYIEGYGKNKNIGGLFAAEKLTIYNLRKLLNKKRRYDSKPKPGFYKVFYVQHQVGYEKVDHPSLIETIHPSIEGIEEDMDFFFNNVNLFTRYNMPGVRKAMLIGPPGTGKTSMCIKFAREFSKTHCVTVATDLQAAAGHLAKCAKHNVPTVVILEDAESTLSDGMGTQSSVLNFLDGVDQPSNSKGAYILMTTNHPERIEDRVLRRPGRIDRIFQVGPLKDKHALDCAKLYFGDDLKYTKKTNGQIESIVSGMTGAQIRELANSTRAYCASNQLDINPESLKEVSSRLTEDLSDALQFAEDNSLMIEKKKQRVGFGNEWETVQDRNGNIPF